MSVQMATDGSTPLVCCPGSPRGWALRGEWGAALWLVTLGQLSAPTGALRPFDVCSLCLRSRLPQPRSELMGAPQVRVPFGRPGTDGGVGVMRRPQPPHHHGREAVELG